MSHLPPKPSDESFAAAPEGGVAIDQDAFFHRISPPQQLYTLFDYLPGVVFFVKDAAGRMMGGSPELVQRLGLSSERELIGCNDYDFFPPHIVEGFLQDDRHVMNTGKPLLGRTEVWFNEQHVFDWFVTNKAPLYGAGGKIIGVMGTVSNLDEKRELLFAGARICRATHYIQENYAERIEIGNLARLSCLSVRQFRRQFQEVFCMSPQVFILKTRMQAACKALVQSDSPLSQIALESGFSDQSSFTLHFRRLLGITPLQFRRRKLGRPHRLPHALHAEFVGR